MRNPNENTLRILKTIGFIFIVIFLTILTQIGGLILVASIPALKLIDKRISSNWIRRSSKSVAFMFIYSLATLIIVPPIAEQFGRAPLPIFSSTNVKPLNIMTCLLNRHYVKPELISQLDEVSNKMTNKYPGTVVAYLDANFPFIDKFPLFPHLSHNDGKKLDVAFLYLDSQTKKRLNRKAPSFIGYGVFVDPAANENDTPNECAKKGYWQYGLLGHLVPQWNKDSMVLDKERTHDLITLFAQDDSISKIFIEPHLKSRLNLTSDKIRFHGCQAVRHDDHIHIQMR